MKPNNAHVYKSFGGFTKLVVHFHSALLLNLGINVPLIEFSKCCSAEQGGRLSCASPNATCKPGTREDRVCER